MGTPPDDKLESDWLFGNDEPDEDAPPALGREERTASPKADAEKRTGSPTLPPPVPESEYVEQMMEQAKSLPGAAQSQHKPWEKEPDAPHRAMLDTLREDEPLRFDLDEPLASLREPSLSGGAGTPTLEPPPVVTLRAPEGPVRASALPTNAPPPGELDLVSELLDELERSEVGGEGSGEADDLSEDDERTTMPGPLAEALLEDVRQRFEAGDYQGALDLARNMLAEDPNHAPAQTYVQSSQEMLRQRFLRKLGDGTFIPKVVIRKEEIRVLTLDHRAGFLLSCVDDISSLDELLDVCGMPPLDALKILHELVDRGVLRMERPGRTTRR